MQTEYTKRTSNTDYAYTHSYNAPSFSFISIHYAVAALDSVCLCVFCFSLSHSFDFFFCFEFSVSLLLVAGVWVSQAVVHGCVACSACRSQYLARCSVLQLELRLLYLQQFSWFRNIELKRIHFFVEINYKKNTIRINRNI